MDSTDGLLLTQFTSGSPDALGPLIRRHLDLVYATALRLTSDPALAEDVAQAVFLILIQKANSLRREASIAGWLVLTTRNVAKTALRAQRRREKYERRAAQSEAVSMDAIESESQSISNSLDHALSRLRSKDRNAITLRYLQAHSLATVGQLLGISEEAARKRTARGIMRLRELLGRRGIATDDARLIDILSASAAVTAPAHLITATLSFPLAASPRAISLCKGTVHMLMFQKTLAILSIFLLNTVIASLTVLAQSNPAPAPTPPAPAQLATGAKDPTDPPQTNPPVLAINTIALQMAVTDVEANIEFFRKIGFGLRFHDKPDADGKLSRATVDCGTMRIRLYRVNAAPNPAKDFTAYFWIDGGEPALQSLHDSIADQGINVGPMGKDQTLLQFDVITPDGYTLGFYSAKP